MIFLELFLTFFKIGAACFGGGYAMISLIRESVLSYGWISEAELVNMIAIAESTPGPIAVNMATFVGSKMGGVLGSLVATLGVVLPSFIIILVISAFIKGFLELKPVKAALSGIRPAIVGLILATAVTIGLSLLFGFTHVGGGAKVDLIGILILAILIAVSKLAKLIFKKPPSPIVMILISAALGALLYSIGV